MPEVKEIPPTPNGKWLDRPRINPALDSQGNPGSLPRPQYVSEVAINIAGLLADQKDTLNALAGEETRGWKIGRKEYRTVIE